MNLSDINTNLVFLRLIQVCIYFPLSAGYTLCLGKSYIFRFNHPEEANRMKSMLPQKSPVSPLVYSTGNLSSFQVFQLILTSSLHALPLTLNIHFMDPYPLRNWNHWSFVHTQPVSHITTRQLNNYGGSSLSYVCMCVCVIHGFSYLSQLFWNRIL